MPQVSRVYLDTNIFIEMYEGSGPVCDALFDIFGACNGRVPTFLATSELTLAETLVDPYRKRDESLIQLYENALLSNDMIEVGPVNREVLYAAAVLRADYPALKLPDAIHLATARLFRCSHFLTFEKRLGGGYSFSHVRHGVQGDAWDISVIRPELETLAAMLAQVQT